MIQANCRANFTADDFSFIRETLAKDLQNKVALGELLTDEEMRDDILDHDELFRRVLESKGFTRISPYLYFYVLSRRVLLEYKINDRQMADYIGSLLAEFGSTNRVFSPSRHHDSQYHYLVDMLNDFIDASSWEAFLLRSHLGNYALFMTGMFPDYIYRKATYGHKVPGFEYYEKMGSSSYQWAAQHKYAARYRLVETLSNLAAMFRQVRIALNKLADEYIVLDEKPDNMDKMLRKIFFGDSDLIN